MKRTLRGCTLFLCLLLLTVAWPATAGTASNPEIDDDVGESNGQTQGLTTVPPSLDFDAIWLDTESPSELTFHLEMVDLADPTDVQATRYYRIAWDLDTSAGCGDGQYQVVVEIQEGLDPNPYASCAYKGGAGENTMLTKHSSDSASVSIEGNDIQVTIPRHTYHLDLPKDSSVMNGLKLQTFTYSPVWTVGLSSVGYPTALGFADQAASSGPVQL